MLMIATSQEPFHVKIYQDMLRLVFSSQLLRSSEICAWLPLLVRRSRSSAHQRVASATLPPPCLRAPTHLGQPRLRLATLLGPTWLMSPLQVTLKFPSLKRPSIPEKAVSPCWIPFYLPRVLQKKLPRAILIGWIPRVWQQCAQMIERLKQVAQKKNEEHD